MTTTIRQIDLPVFSTNQKIAFGILCVKEVYHNDRFNKWANEWLDGSNRTEEAATAYSAAAYYAAYYAAAAEDAAAAANAASCVAGNKINFVEIAEKAMTYK